MNKWILTNTLKNASDQVIEKYMNNYSGFEVKTRDPNIRVEYRNDEKIIKIYYNGTIVEYDRVNDKKMVFKPRSAVKTFSTDELSIIGADEVGTGDFFGPIITCACFVTNSQALALKKLKITDSKRYNSTQISVLARRIMEMGIIHDTFVLDNDDYNNMQDAFKNMNIIKAYMHNDTLCRTIAKVPKAYKYSIILDEFVNETKYYEYLQTLEKQWGTDGVKKIIKIDGFVQKAESKYVSVACASILARFYFLCEIERLERLLGARIPLGSTNVDKIYKTLEHLMKSGLNPRLFCKTNFKSYASLSNKISEKE